MALRPYHDIALEYANDVLNGSIPACKFVRLACQRFLTDLEKRIWIFDQTKADRICRFIEALPHTKGEWASKHELLVLQPWQIFILQNVFGFVDHEGYRRYNQATIICPRKNGKSLFSAAVGIYMMVADGEFSSEVYCGATTERQSWEVFTPARLICKNTPALLKRFGVAVNAKTISRADDGSVFRPLIGKPGDGASPHCAILDERHEHTNNVMRDAMRTGMGARRQPLLWSVTTAGFDLASPCYDDVMAGRQILEGTLESDRWFYVEYSIDANPVVTVYQSFNSLFKMENDCTCGLVHPTLIERLWHEVCAMPVIRSGTVKIRQKDVSTIRTDRREPEECVDHVMSNFSSMKTLRERPATLASERNGRGIIQIALNETITDGIQNRSRNSRCETIAYLHSMAFHLRNLTNSLKSRAVDAAYVEQTKRVYASIIATLQERLEDSSAESVIQDLAFSEILKRLFNAHSPTCNVKGLRLVEGGLEETLPEDDWTTVESARKASPNFGISVNETFIRGELQDAINIASKQNAYKTKYLCVWAQAKDAFHNLQNWNKNYREMNLEDFKGRTVILGCDFAAKQDVCAIAILVPLDDGTFAVFGKFYLPSDAVNQPGRNHYVTWQNNQKIEVFDGNMNDFDSIEMDIDELVHDYDVQKIVIDARLASMMEQHLIGKGYPVEAFIPSAVNYTEPMRWIDGLINEGKLLHNSLPNDPATWMVANVTSRANKRDMEFPDKEREESKIDFPVALYMTAAEYLETPILNIQSLFMS